LSSAPPQFRSLSAEIPCSPLSRTKRFLHVAKRPSRCVHRNCHRRNGKKSSGPHDLCPLLSARSLASSSPCAGAASKGYAIGRRGFQESAQALSIGRPSPRLQQKVASHRPRFREPRCCLFFFLSVKNLCCLIWVAQEAIFSATSHEKQWIDEFDVCTVPFRYFYRSGRIVYSFSALPVDP
jgi:hypothetical protein